MYWKDRWNRFDFTLVFGSLLLTYMIPVFINDFSDTADSIAVQNLRLGKLVRVDH